MIQNSTFEEEGKGHASERPTSAFKFGQWIVLEGINASYNPETKQIIFNIMGEGFSTLATKDMEEFLESLIAAPNARSERNKESPQEDLPRYSSLRK